ncbi:MAG TPA: Crp/Fnr family transcriptional regulator [Sphingorhabdus sp.]|jgi:CRP-like cAMP-binding protein|nr:Crp/Fnr family transcriptional regulator [Sphingorhabdus sp.]
MQGKDESPGRYLIAKLNAFMRTSSGSEEAINEMASRRLVTLDRGQDIISEGEEPRTVHLLVSGWACRYKMMEDGRRQILAFFVPGDLADLHVYILKSLDHSIAAVTPVTYSKLAPKEFEEISDGHPRLLRALWWESLVTDSIQREWLVSAGQRDALESVAHLACELFLRLKTVGLVEGRKCAFPLTQLDIADALGMTQPHVSRTIAELNRSGVATLKRGTLEVHSQQKLQQLAAFNPNYLHHLYDE